MSTTPGPPVDKDPLAPAEPGIRHDPYAVLRIRDFRLLLIGVFVASLGQYMATVALGWELSIRTGSALVLGFVGLAQIIPVFLFSLPAGHIVDRYNRKWIILSAEIVYMAASIGIAVLSATTGPLILIYLCLVFIGSAQAFSQPASSAFIANVIPPNLFESATTWRSTTWQLSAVTGPAAGGFLIGVLGGATWVFVINAGAALAFVLLLLPIQPRAQSVARTREKATTAVIEGLDFLRRTPVLLAAITLDMVAVLLGGATTLLPVFAKSILQVGPFGLGWLQAASSLGAVCMALLLAHRPPFRHAGWTLLLAVGGFGLATIGFGLSRWFPLSMAMLFLLGALDNISVVIRGTLVLVRTPDEMRGRVAAVNSLFIGTSNQLGGFESGLAAQILGPVAAVVIGGIGTIAVVAAVAALWPQMRELGTLADQT